MKILHTIDLYYPYKGGAQEAILQLSKRLVEHGHEVTIATTKIPERTFDEHYGIKIEEFDISGNFLKGYVGDVERYRSFLLSSDFDIIMNFSCCTWATDLLLPLMDSIAAKKVLTPCGFYTLYWPRYREYYDLMKAAIPKYDCCIVMSESYRDTEFVKEHNGRYVVIPNGADEREFLTPPSNNLIRKKLEIPEDHFLILLVGNHTGHKGHADAIRIFKRAHITDATLLIVAGNVYGRVLGPLCNLNCMVQKFLNRFNPFSRRSHKSILIERLDREDVVQSYLSADLFLFPSMIECSPIVLFECLGSGTPFLVTDVGNAKEIIGWTHAGELLPTHYLKNGFCRVDVRQAVPQLEALIMDKERLKKYSDNGFASFKENFTWEKTAQKHEDLYRSLL
jgi:glycosyltransferase involved in cell wall biosynthesis